MNPPLVMNFDNNVLCFSPITYAWSGGKVLSQQSDFKSKCMTREQYEEEGVRGVTEKFAIWMGHSMTISNQNFNNNYFRIVSY